MCKGDKEIVECICPYCLKGIISCGSMLLLKWVTIREAFLSWHGSHVRKKEKKAWEVDPLSYLGPFCKEELGEILRIFGINNN